MIADFLEWNSRSVSRARKTAVSTLSAVPARRMTTFGSIPGVSLRKMETTNGHAGRRARAGRFGHGLVGSKYCKRCVSDFAIAR
ncbi:MAG TPA: hypothetical protein VHE78_11130 [Gemmatimonadaceae bacterium]|nr:hypothetical protein [Gemmatimonadaceae bacterium]